MSTSNEYTMKLRDRPEYRSKPKPLTYQATAMVKDAVDTMSALNYGSVVVVDAEDRVTGIVTERDIMRKIVAEQRDPKTTPLSDIMTANPRVARETDEVVDWLRIMSNERFRRLPVVDDEGRVKVIFTQGDFVSYTWPDLIYQAKELVKASAGRNYPVLLIGGGIMLYSLLMIGVVASLT